jgi:hypothetical protein
MTTLRATELSRDRVGAQNEAYRKGLVLGLTMAEVGILIIFVLLLLLALGEVRRASLVRRFQNKTAVDATELARLTAAEQTLRQIAQELGVSAPVADNEDFTKLVRVIREAVKTPGAKEALAQASAEISSLAEARKEFAKLTEAGRKGGPGEITRQVEQQTFRIANQDGQLKLLERKLANAGQGKGERPCWVQPGGTIDYLYDVALTSRGIRMKERTYVERQRERALLPAPAVDPDEVLSEATFYARTRPLYLHSLQNNCRFFVVIYDATASHEKPLYKSLLRTVEGHFYKRLDNGPAPF